MPGCFLDYKGIYVVIKWCLINIDRDMWYENKYTKRWMEFFISLLMG